MWCPKGSDSEAWFVICWELRAPLISSQILHYSNSAISVNSKFDFLSVLNDSSTSNDSGILPFTSSRSQLLNASDLINNTNTNVGLINPNFASNVSLYRPPSARSSYSNYHGVRTLAFSKQATPQVPTNSYRRNSRSAYSTFLNDGPPAYEIQGAVNSETVI